MWELYDELISGIGGDIYVEELICGLIWTMVRTNQGGVGLAMTTNVHAYPVQKRGYRGMELKRAAESVRSWNLIEAGIGMAAINAFYNTPERLEKLHAEQKRDGFCSMDIPHEGKNVCMVGALKCPKGYFDSAASFSVFERDSVPGAFPDTAEEYILPKSDLAVITGSALVNKTMPRLLLLTKSGCPVITGPTTPMSETLLRHGAKRLAGLVITDPDGCREMVCEGYNSSPYGFGRKFMLE